MAPSIRAVLLGFFGWFIPFAASFLLFPVRRANAPLFATIMYLVLLLTAGALFSLYFRGRILRPAEAMLVGFLWLVMSLGFDFPLFAFGPMKMTAIAYYSEVGLVYLTFPVFALLAASLAKRV